jgi:RHS repeat-associated protein
VWAGTHLAATFDACGLHFHVADPLGTRRVQVNRFGQFEESIQSLPFGDNLVQEAGGGSLCTVSSTEHHFTGKEHDSESGNDYFGARYYNSAVARFMSPDWSAKVEPVPYAKLDNPQSLNLYAYLNNNPLRTIDPDGHEEADPCRGQNNCSYNASTHIATLMTSTSSQKTTGATQDANGNTTSFTLTQTKTTTTANMLINSNGTATPLDGFERTTTTVTTMTRDNDEDGSYTQTASNTTTSGQLLNGGDVARKEPELVTQINDNLKPTFWENVQAHPWTVGLGAVGGTLTVAAGCVGTAGLVCGLAVAGGVVTAGGGVVIAGTQK